MMTWEATFVGAINSIYEYTYRNITMQFLKFQTGKGSGGQINCDLFVPQFEAVWPSLGFWYVFLSLAFVQTKWLFFFFCFLMNKMCFIKHNKGYFQTITKFWLAVNSILLLLPLCCSGTFGEGGWEEWWEGSHAHKSKIKAFRNGATQKVQDQWQVGKITIHFFFTGTYSFH